jgi:hypothetical protein
LKYFCFLLSAFSFQRKCHIRHKTEQARRKAAKQTDHQAHLWAFVDNFRLFGLLALGCVPLIFLFKRIKREPVRAVEAP